MQRASKSSFAWFIVVLISITEDFIFQERVVIVMDSSPLPGDYSKLNLIKIEYVAVTAKVVRLL